MGSGDNLVVGLDSRVSHGQIRFLELGGSLN